MPDIEVESLQSQARQEVEQRYTAQYAERLSTDKLIVLASDTVSHAYRLARINHGQFLGLPSLHPERYDAQARQEILERAQKNHRQELIQTFTTRGVSKETSEQIIDREIISPH